MARRRKPIGWLVGALRTPPIGIEARRHAGMLLRMLYRIDADAIFVIEWFAKKTQKTPKAVIDACRARVKRYDRVSMETLKR